MKIIDYSVIDKNIKKIKKTNDICLVLKNDAYGFGMKRVLDIALSNDINNYAVNTIDEAIELRGYCDCKILLFGYCLPYIELLKEYNILPTANSKAEIDIYKQNNIKYALEIDSGMNRFGIKDYSDILFNDRLLDTIYIHFYKKNDSNIELISTFSEVGIANKKNFHFGGSLVYGDTRYMLRIGKIIYNNSLSFYGRVCILKDIDVGETVGYEGEYKAIKKERIAVLDVGYYNGIKMHYNGYVFCNKKRYKVVGRICMNHTFVIVDEEVRIGDMMEFFGRNILIDEFLLYNQMSEYECFLSIR